MIPFVMETIILYCNCQIYFYLHFITASCYTKVFTYCTMMELDIQVVEI